MSGLNYPGKQPLVIHKMCRYNNTKKHENPWRRLIGEVFPSMLHGVLHGADKPWTGRLVESVA